VRAHRRGWAAGLLAGAAGVAVIGPVLLGPISPVGAAGTRWDVAVADKAFSPSHLRINPGDRVLWTNEDGNTKHSVTSDSGSTSFDEDLGKSGATFERRFDTADTYTYHCKYHSTMRGTIDVGAPATTTSTTAPATTTSTTEPPTTTTTAPATTTTEAPTTTTTAPRPAAGPIPAPPVPSSAAAPPPTASSSTTSAPSTTTTSTAPPTTATSAPPTLAGEDQPAPPASEAPPSPAEATGDTGDEIPTAAGPPAAPAGKLDVGAVALVSALVAVGAFGAWTLIRVRPGRV